MLCCGHTDRPGRRLPQRGFTRAPIVRSWREDVSQPAAGCLEQFHRCKCPKSSVPYLVATATGDGTFSPLIPGKHASASALTESFLYKSLRCLRFDTLNGKECMLPFCLTGRLE